MLERFSGVIARGELRHGVMHVLILLVLHLQRHDGQAVEEEDEVNLVVALAEIEVRAEGDAVLAVLLGGGALGRARLGVVQPELQPAHLQAHDAGSSRAVCAPALCASARNTSSRASVP